jgi:tRNA-Thr(GGU) m(6)t(6)A37 methyltransferase TsaA
LSKRKAEAVFLQPIGVIHSPYKEKKGTPFQGRHENKVSTIELYEEYEPGLLDIQRCTHLFVLYWQDRSDRSILQTRTPWGPEIHGVFSTRSPNRPNPIGLCVVDFLERDGRFVKVNGLDALDGSPIVDIKPYSAGIDSYPNAAIGWLKEQEGKPPGKL